jgi:predicted O-methyltransferase YrrM
MSATNHFAPPNPLLRIVGPTVPARFNPYGEPIDGSYCAPCTRVPNGDAIRIDYTPTPRPEAGFTEEWFCQASQDALAELVRIVEPLDGLLIEVGAWEGRSTVAMANAAYPRLLHSCDTWRGSESEISGPLAAQRDVHAQWLVNIAAMTDGNVVEHHCNWRDWLPTVTEPVALAFIDAEHSYVEVRDNLRALVPLMLPGGIICGDDAHHGPVQEALTEVLGTMIFCTATVWVWQMPTDQDGRDAALLRACHRDLWPEDPEIKNALAEVVDVWKDYTTFVSPMGHAASLETVAYLAHVNFKRKPKRILDLGSGISSAVLRMRGGDVSTIDTDTDWLNRTIAFLERHSLPMGGMRANREPDGLFDLIFLDIANGATREQWAEVAVDHLAPGGLIVFDDMQSESHAAVFAELCERNGITLYSLKHITNDAIGRWSALGIKEGVASERDSTLFDRYERHCRDKSDIQAHVPRMVSLAQQIEAKHIIELGSRTGVSTVAWLYALEQTGGRLTSIDLDPKPDIGDFDHWTFIQGDDLDPEILDRLEPADIVFIDTSHDYPQTLTELETYWYKVKPGGFICLHDTELQWPTGAKLEDGPYPVKRAMTEFAEHHQFQFVNFPEDWGFAIVKVGDLA